MIDCSSRLEADLLSHDKQVEDVERIAAEEDVIVKEVIRLYVLQLYKLEVPEQALGRIPVG